MNKPDFRISEGSICAWLDTVRENDIYIDGHNTGVKKVEKYYKSKNKEELERFVREWCEEVDEMDSLIQEQVGHDHITQTATVLFKKIKKNIRGFLSNYEPSKEDKDG